MYLSLPDGLRMLAVSLNPEGEVTKKFRPDPTKKPRRRQPAFKNKSNRSDYFKTYMQDYRGDKGKDYQKTPDKVKELRKKNRRRLKEKFHPLTAYLVDQELNFWAKNGKTVDPEEFEFICSRRGFSEQERQYLAEELDDLGLIIL